MEHYFGAPQDSEPQETVGCEAHVDCLGHPYGQNHKHDKVVSLDCCVSRTMIPAPIACMVPLGT